MGSMSKLFNRIYDMELYEIQRSFPYLGEGISRAVFAVNNDYVVKVAKDLDGDYQCKVEYYVYTHTNKILKDYLCPIVWYKRGMIAMPRAIPLSYYIREPYIDISKVRSDRNSYEDLIRLSNKFNLLFEDIVSTSSWGILNNRMVLIDYGCTN
ncbi:hypothetical protein SAMN05443428_10240 [Caloramator quimbayensis]|uniref:Serine/threonine protein kinase n=2 Tax=Caloramator quimbayensis TaxID=1147123 RepID=A0A1T4WKZ2_9CLOT|nr:hypothetical protein SAMN05443428_10240 [Caloramator quimbayensis]